MFIPPLERSGAIVDLDLAIFEQCCRFLRDRLDKGAVIVPLNCNFSRLHMRNDAFPETVKSIVDGFGVPIELLELELTENIVMEDLERAERLCRRLKDLGFRIAIDDFGSGYSSLGTLQNLPIDVLKLDREFLLESSLPGTEETVVRFVITMARELRMETVMEGVETPKQLASLRTTECDMVQGFVFSRPVPPEEFYRLLETGAPDEGAFRD